MRGVGYIPLHGWGVGASSLLLEEKESGGEDSSHWLS